jgi:peptide/nickel transport system permease protein
MLVYTIRRLLATIPVLFVASVFVFLLVDISGDPVANLLLRNPPPPQSTIDAFRADLYLDRSMPERYWLWLTGVGGDGCTTADWFGEACNIGLLRGEFGPSVRGANHDVGAEIGNKLLTSFRLVFIAALAGVVLGVAAGVFSAIKQYSARDHFLTFLGFVGLSMPIFWLAALIKEVGIWINNDVVGSRIFFTTGATARDTRGMTALETLNDIAAHLILPTVTLMLAGFAVFARFQRASMLEVLNSDYVRLARAKGLPNRVVMRRHALRTALIPVTTIAVLSIVGLIDGAVLTETVFQWRGLGVYFVESAGGRDTFAVMGVVLIIGVSVVLANLVADLLYGVLDPRIRYE